MLGWVVGICSVIVAVPVVAKWGRRIGTAVLHPVVTHRLPPRPHLAIVESRTSWVAQGAEDGPSLVMFSWYVTDFADVSQTTKFTEATLLKPVKTLWGKMNPDANDETKLNVTFVTDKPVGKYPNAVRMKVMIEDRYGRRYVFRHRVHAY